MKILPRSRIRSNITLLIIFLFISCSAFAQDRPNPGVIPLQLGQPQVSDEQLALQLYQTRQFEQAAEVYKRLYEKSQTQYYYSYYLFCLIELRDYDAARKLVREQQKKEGDALKLQVDLGYLTFREGNQDRSVKIYEEVLRKLQPNQQQIFEVANAFTSRSENEYAIKAYLRGRELLGNPALFGFELAAVYERMGNYGGAVDAWLDLLVANPAYMNTVQDRLQNLLADDPDNERGEIIRKKILVRAQKENDNLQYAELLWWYSVQQKDFSMAFIQARAIDARQKDGGERIIQLSKLAEANGDNKTALDAWDYLIRKGPSSPWYEVARLEKINTLYRIAIADPSATQDQLRSTAVSMREELDRWKGLPQSRTLMKNLAHLEAFYLDNPEAAIQLLEKARVLEGTTLAERSECKIELADIYLLTGEVWEATLLYQQVYKDFKNDVLGQTAKFKNAQLSFYIGEYDWAKAQADILKAATSRLISNDAIALSLLIGENYDPDSGRVALGMYARADLLAYRNHDEEAQRTLDSVLLMFNDHPILDDVLLKKADIMVKDGKLAEADSLYRQVTDLFPEGVLADLALFRRAEIYDLRLQNSEKAMELYQELITGFPDSVFVTDARKRFRTLQGS